MAIFTIPTDALGSYDCHVDWGDGTIDYITTYNDPKWSHNYTTATKKTISISGVFSEIKFNNSGDKLSIVDIVNWGTGNWTAEDNAFYGCTNLKSTAIDNPILSKVTNTSSMFRGCLVFNSDLSSWDISKVTVMSNMLDNTALSPANYDKLLIAWAAQTVKLNVIFGAAGVKYTSAATIARDKLITTYGWVITDGGLV